MNQHEDARSHAQGNYPPARAPDRRRSRRRLLACLLVLLAVLLFWAGRVAWLIATAPARPFDVGPDTTRITAHGRYPEKLSDLVPRYLDHVPCDIRTGKPPKYTASARGLRITATGPIDQALEMSVGAAD
jgi:hypothetical protein